jgi:hypothetical protein
MQLWSEHVNLSLLCSQNLYDQIKERELDGLCNINGSDEMWTQNFVRKTLKLQIIFDRPSFRILLIVVSKYFLSRLDCFTPGDTASGTH